MLVICEFAVQQIHNKSYKWNLDLSRLHGGDYHLWIHSYKAISNLASLFVRPVGAGCETYLIDLHSSVLVPSSPS